MLALGGLLAASAGLGVIGRRLTPRPDHVLTIGGRRLAITESGSGPAILFLHGLGGQAGNFHLLPPLLPGFRCIIPDRPGSGWSDPAAPGRAGIGGHAASAAAIIEALGAGPVLVVGHSLGGAIGLRLARDRPHLVAGLVGIGALTGPQLPRLAGFGAALGGQWALREALIRLAGPPMLPALLPWFIRISFAPEPVPAGFAVPGGLLAGLAPRMGNAVMRDLEVVAKGAPRLRRDLPGIRQPVTLLHGIGDQVLPWRHHAAEAAALIPGARLWLPDGGHMLPATRPALVAAAIRATAHRSGLYRSVP